MRVAYITMQFPYPSETFAAVDVRTLKKLGVDIRVHCLRFPHPKFEVMVRERDLGGLEITHTSALSVLRGLGQGVSNPGLFLELLSWIVRANWRAPEHLLKSLLLAPRAVEIFARLRRERPDVVHLFWGHYPSLVAYLVTRRLPETVLSLSLAAYDLTMGYGGSADIAHKADFVTTHAYANRPDVAAHTGLSPEAVTVVHRSLDVARMQALVPERPTKVPKRVLTAGRLQPSKSMDKVLDVFARVHARHPEATLHVLGDGPERQSLQVKARNLGIEEAVVFKGHVGHDEVFREMADAEVFLFMSKHESERLPNVVKEAIFCECVCVVTDTVGITELVPDDGHGFVVPIDGVDEAAGRMLQVFDHPDLKTDLLKAAKEHVLEHFDVEKAMRRYVKAWSEKRKRGTSDLESGAAAA